MTDLIFISYANEAAAFQASTELFGLQRELQITAEAVVVVTRAPNGAVSLHQAVSMTKAGTVASGTWGALIGMFILNPSIGAAVTVKAASKATGKAGVAPGKLTDIGIDEVFLRGVSKSLDKGGAALGVLLRHVTADKLLKGIAVTKSKGRVLQTTLSQEAEARLKAVLDHVPPIGAAPAQSGVGQR